jgi:hypothetical protein
VPSPGRTEPTERPAHRDQRVDAVVLRYTEDGPEPGLVEQVPDREGCAEPFGAGGQQQVLHGGVDAGGLGEATRSAATGGEPGEATRAEALRDGGAASHVEQGRRARGGALIAGGHDDRGLVEVLGLVANGVGHPGVAVVVHAGDHGAGEGEVGVDDLAPALGEAGHDGAVGDGDEGVVLAVRTARCPGRSPHDPLDHVTGHRLGRQSSHGPHGGHDLGERGAGTEGDRGVGRL